jgi:hypothetical protein
MPTRTKTKNQATKDRRITKRSRQVPHSRSTTSASRKKAKLATESGNESDAEQRSLNEDSYQDDDIESLDSDALDEDFDSKAKSRGKGAKPAMKRSPRKKRKASEDEDNPDTDIKLLEGQEVIGRVVQAPKSGRVPPGQISRNTLGVFLIQGHPRARLLPVFRRFFVSAPET